MRIIEGTPVEIVEYERLASRNGGESTEGESPPTDGLTGFSWTRFPPASQEFARAYVARAEDECGLKVVAVDTGGTHYVRMMLTDGPWNGAVVYVNPIRVDFRLRHEDVHDITNGRVEKKIVEGKNLFRVTIRRQTIDDVDAAMELTRRAIAVAAEL